MDHIIIRRIDMDAYEDILTSRLVLKSMSVPFLRSCLNDDAEKAAETIGLRIPREWLQEKELAAIRMNDCLSDPAYIPWSLRAIGLGSSREMVGHIGFHSRPNPDYLRQFGLEGVEFGYTVFPGFRQQGYATEAIRGLLGWAARQHGIRNFVVSIAPTNEPSKALTAKLGFVKIGEHQDEVDGLEEVYLLSGEALDGVLAGG